ncbi:MAG TPA: hypothetical protein VJB57_09690 [Dehalococcoidia bacterium]|nr:hypothetical protein [Dehalococcoidia bacterium]
MAKIVGGFASSHSPMMHTAGDQWGRIADFDPRNNQLVKMPEGKRVSFDELLASADPEIAKQVNLDTFIKKEADMQRSMDELEKRFVQTDPDVVVMFGDDQNEWFFDDNYPTINLYWGESIQVLSRNEYIPDAPTTRRSYLTEEREWPVDTELGLRILESLMDQDFDVAQSRYQREAYGGSIGPGTWYLDSQRKTQPRPMGMPHAFGFPIGRWFGGKTIPIVPISINTCYPPNWISARRAYALGRAVRNALDNLKTDKRIAIATSGGLSHFVVDEELDRIALKGMTEANGEILTSLPRHRLQAATTETLNWVAVAGVMGSPMDLISYQPGYRTPAGTGVGLAVGHWEVK